MIGLTRTDGLGFLMTFPNQSFILPFYNFQTYAAYFNMIYSLACLSDRYFLRQFYSLQKTSSTFINSKGFSYASLPTIHPQRLFYVQILQLFTTLFSPPLISNESFGKSFFNLQTLSYISGGTVLFCAGLSPFKNAFLAWITKWVIGPQPPRDTSLTNYFTNQQESKSSTPSLHLTVQLTFTAFFIVSMQSLTRAASFIRQAPKDPFCTLGEGQPTFRLIQSQPYF